MRSALPYRTALCGLYISGTAALHSPAQPRTVLRPPAARLLASYLLASYLQGLRQRDVECYV